MSNIEKSFWKLLETD